LPAIASHFLQAGTLLAFLVEEKKMFAPLA
jgi:hypothetical protein